jgi:predicted small lipoprotein YifL
MRRNECNSPIALVMLVTALAACGSSATGPAPAQVPAPIAARADVSVTLDGKRHTCVVALYNEPQGNAIPCGDVVPFLKDELRLKPGSIYDLHTIPDVDKAEIARVTANLKTAGYRFIGGHEER